MWSSLGECISKNTAITSVFYLWSKSTLSLICVRARIHDLGQDWQSAEDPTWALLGDSDICSERERPKRGNLHASAGGYQPIITSLEHVSWLDILDGMKFADHSVYSLVHLSRELHQNQVLNTQ